MRMGKSKVDVPLIKQLQREYADKTGRSNYYIVFQDAALLIELQDMQRGLRKSDWYRCFTLNKSKRKQNRVRIYLDPLLYSTYELNNENWLKITL